MNSPLAPFTKMNGIGNHILVLDMRGRSDQLTGHAIRSLREDPRILIDQIMVLHETDHPKLDARISIFNADGSAARACGNGMRCVVATLAAQTGQTRFLLETPSEIIHAWQEDDHSITIDMGTPLFDWQDIPLSEEFSDTRNIELQIGPIDNPELHSPSIVNVGNTHTIFWVDRDPAEYSIDKIGPLIGHHPLFPNGTNVSIALISSPETIRLRVWELGAGVTAACGTAACAATVCAARLGKTGRRVTVSMPGGALRITWDPHDHIHMTGSATFEFSGSLDPATGFWKTSAHTGGLHVR